LRGKIVRKYSSRIQKAQGTQMSTPLVCTPGHWEEKTKRHVIYLTAELRHRLNLGGGGGQGIGMPLQYFYT